MHKLWSDIVATFKIGFCTSLLILSPALLDAKAASRGCSGAIRILYLMPDDPNVVVRAIRQNHASGKLQQQIKPQVLEALEILGELISPH